MPTFGHTGIGANSAQNNSNFKRVAKFTLSEDGDVTKLTYYTRGGITGGQDLKAVIYADSAGAPAALLATGTAVNIANSQAAGWVDLPLTSTVRLTAGTYWIGALNNVNNQGSYVYYDASGGFRTENTDTYSDGPANPFGVPALTDTILVSCYATYTAVAPFANVTVTA